MKAHQNFGKFRGTMELEWIAWVRQILVRNLADHHRRFSLEGRKVSRERSLDAARILWARAMQRVGGLLKGRVS